MAKEYAVPGAIARKNEAMIRKRLSSVGLAAVANAMGVAESTVCRMKDADDKDGTSQIQRWAAALEAMGLKCVPVHFQCFDPKEIEALFTLAKGRIERMESAAELVWDDE
jgi:hypothetical protein